MGKGELVGGDLVVVWGAHDVHGNFMPIGASTNRQGAYHMGDQMANNRVYWPWSVALPGFQDKYDAVCALKVAK